MILTGHLCIRVVIGGIQLAKVDVIYPFYRQG